MSTIKQGNTGAEVVRLQRLLQANHYEISEHGIFDESTHETVCRFQEANELEVDGIVGDQTWNALERMEFGKSMTLEELSHRMEVPTNWLTALFNIESQNKTAAENPFTGAIGLIQFMPDTAKALGTTTDLLKTMEYEEQLVYVYRYLKEYTRRIKSFSDLYFSVFFPLAIGKPDDWVLETKKLSALKIAEQNPCYDCIKDGKITVAEVKKVIYKKSGLDDELQQSS